MKHTLASLALLFMPLAHAQQSNTSDFTDNIEEYKLADLWILDQFQIENGTSWVDRPEPLGYIGENYQRFYIHFVSAVQNPENKLQYLIVGKTRVKSNICAFHGTITVEYARTYDLGDTPLLRQGFFSGRYEFFEDPNQNGSGILKGKFRTNFYIDKKGQLKYDALMFVSDGFNNNQFEGSWTSYKTGKSKKCNWGDYRIPDSRELDVGAGEFSPIAKFVEYGWQNYRLAWGSAPNQPDVVNARKREKERWWIEE